MTRLSPRTPVLALSILLTALGCQSAQAPSDANNGDDGGHDGSTAARDTMVADGDAGTTRDATTDGHDMDAQTLLDAAHDSSGGLDGASADAAVDAQTTALDATPPWDASPTLDAHVINDAAASDAAADDTDAAAPMCRTSGPCTRDEECCWFCHDQDHCH